MHIQERKSGNYNVVHHISILLSEIIWQCQSASKKRVQKEASKSCTVFDSKESGITMATEKEASKITPDIDSKANTDKKRMWMLMVPKVKLHPSIFKKLKKILILKLLLTLMEHGCNGNKHYYQC